MYRKSSQSDLTPEKFELPVAIDLSSDNRWVIMANLISWSELARSLPTFLTPKAIGKAKKLTASRFEPGVRSWVQMTLCYESSCLHQNQLDWAQKAIYLA